MSKDRFPVSDEQPEITQQNTEIKNLLYNLRVQFEARKNFKGMNTTYIKGFLDAIALVGKGVNTLEGIERSK